MLLLQHLCDIARKQAVGTNGRKEVSTIASNVQCLVLPTGSNSTVTNNFDISRTVDFYFPLGTDVQVGDVLTYAGATYAAKGVQTFSVPTAGHIHVQAQQETA